MWEFEIIHNETKERKIIWGYSLSDAFRRSPSLKSDDWECIGHEYID